MARGRSIEDNLEEGVWGIESYKEETSPSQWATFGSRIYKGMMPTHKNLPAGVYSVTIDNNDDKSLFVRQDIKTDEVIRFDDSVADQVLSEITSFWGKAKRFHDAGFLHRRGYLLYGPQGTGKSSAVQQVVRDVVSRKGVVLICDNPKFFSKGLMEFRKMEPVRPVVCIFEDIDAIIKKYGEDELLSILDGANMVDHCLNIATTNYPELLDKRIVSRPRRFDRVIKIPLPGKDVRTAYLKQKLPKKANLKLWIAKTENLSFAGMAEAIVSVYCLGNDFDRTIEIITNIEGSSPSSEDFRKDFGTKLGFDDDDEMGGASPKKAKD